jgi:hypothetical protein
LYTGMHTTHAKLTKINLELAAIVDEVFLIQIFDMTWIKLCSENIGKYLSNVEKMIQKNM